MKRRVVNAVVVARMYEHPAQVVKRFMKKVKNEKIVEEYREKTDFFEKPSKIAKRKKARRKMIAQRRFAEQSSPKKEKQNGRV